MIKQWHQLRLAVRDKSRSLGPGSHLFLKSLSIVTLFFGLSKIFSSLATVIIARYLGPAGYGEAQVILLVAQFLSLVMLLSLHTTVIKYGSGQDNPARVIATTLFFSAVFIVLTGAAFWLGRGVLQRWIDLSDQKILWALQLGLLFAVYGILTSLYQTLNLFKQRGVIELAFAFLLLPGLAIGAYFTGRTYETLLTCYAVAYLLCLPPMLWRFRHFFRISNLFAPETKEMLFYGLLSLCSNTGYIITFLVQPLQLQESQGEHQVGLFRLYCAGSVNLATFASTIFYTVFFPKVSASQDKQGIWNRLTKAWVRGAVPVMLTFAAVLALTVSVSGKEYPLLWEQVLLFSLASTLITITTTYGQILAAQGVRGMRWGLILSLVSGCVNFGLSYWLIPRLGINGAVLALIGNYAITLAGAFAVKNDTLRPSATRPAGR